MNILIILTATLIFYLPILVNPGLILERGNDLQEFFWPIYYFVKTHLISDKSLPLWNNLFLSGTPLLPDPQSPLFYPPNILALFFSINSFFIISFIFHSFVAGVGMYLCAKNGFNFSKATSIILAILYLTTPKLAGYLEAGHIGLINSMAWIPFVVFATIKTRQKPSLKYSIILALSLALLYFSHLPTFLIIATSAGIFLILLSLLNRKLSVKKSILYFLIAGLLTFGLTAISLLPQFEWQKTSTRYLLLNDKDVYPKWKSAFEPIKLSIVPWINGLKNMQGINSEKWISIGIIPATLAFLGFLKLKRKHQLLISIWAALIFLIVLNNASPIYPLLLKQNWYLLLRVSTRFWILIILITIYSMGISLESLNKSKKRFLLYSVFFLSLAESLILGWSYLLKPVKAGQSLAPKEVYEYLVQDKSLFRVFCTTRCLSQKTASIYNLQLLDGYATLHQKNFYQHAWQLMGTYWNYYSLSIPPFGTFTEKLKPDPKALGEYNVKYLISPYQLTDRNFILKTKLKKFFIYENKLLQPRANAPIVFYSPNKIRVDTSNFKGNQVILAEVYSPGWKAYLNGKEKAAVQETPNALRAVDIKPDTKFVDFKYYPDSYKIGKHITFSTIILLIGFGFYQGFLNHQH